MCFSEIKYYAFLKSWGVTVVMDNYDITIVKVVPRMQFQVFMDINL